MKKIALLFVFLFPVVLMSGCPVAAPEPVTTTTTSGTGTTSSTTATSSTTSTTAGGGTHNLTRLFFLHHSVGHGIILGYYDNEYGSPPAGTVNLRQRISNYNAANGTSFALWDHGYNLDVSYGTGLTNDQGVQTGTDYNIPETTPDDITPEDWSDQPGGNTTPAGYQALWTSSNASWESVRNIIMASFEVIAFKSCYYDSRIEDNDTLDTYRTRYLAMRDYFDAHPEKLFVVIPPPPWSSTSTEDGGITQATADRGRIFANWLKSTSASCTWYSGTVPGFLNGSHPNVVCFDLFDELAGTDNFLRSAYRYGTNDNHPNSVANNHLAEVFGQFLIDAALSY